MRLVIVGADGEENLGVGYVAAAALRAGHQVTVVPLDDRQRATDVVATVLGHCPTLVGLSIQFQRRVDDFLTLASLLRQRGFAGHLTCGGNPASLAWSDLLAHAPALDSVVLFEGEETVVDLLKALEAGTDLASVSGLALRDAAGAPFTTEHRPLCQLLDAHPEPLRYRPHSRLLGVPVIPVLWTRGCWGNCTFCSATSFYREAKEHHRGGVYRQRSVEGLADEMARLYHAAGGGIFFFHDDTFLLPRPEDSLARLLALRHALDERGVGRIGIGAKVRPDALTRDLARELRALDVIRLIVGVENASADGLVHLEHRMSVECVGAALDACREADIFADYDLQLFEPATRLSHVAANVDFMRQHTQHLVRFGRVEPFAGTALHQVLRAAGRLHGDHRAWDYRLDDDRSELLHRIVAATLARRTASPAGLVSHACTAGFQAKVLKLLAGDSTAAAIDAETAALCSRVTVNSADHLAAAAAFAAQVELAAQPTIDAFTLALGARVAADDAALGADVAALGRRAETHAAAHAGWPIDGGAPGEAAHRAARARAFVQRAGSATILGFGARATAVR